MNHYLNIIKKIIKNQDTNYISGVVVSILSALILHGFIKVPYILTTKIFRFCKYNFKEIILENNNF